MRSKADIMHDWLEKAEHDLIVAQLTRNHIPEYHEIIAFHCQQSVEKNLKGLLIFFDVEPEKTHDLLYLSELVSRYKTLPDGLFDKLIRLQGFAVEVRYPNEIIRLSGEEIDLAISISAEIQQFVLMIIEEK